MQPDHLNERRLNSMVSNQELAEMIKELTTKVEDVGRDIKSVSKAFPTNDLKEPDFDGHRKAHIGMMRTEKIMENYKVEASKKVIGWIAVFIFGLIASGLVAGMKEALAKL